MFVTVENPWQRRDDGKSTLIMVEGEREDIAEAMGRAIALMSEDYGVSVAEREAALADILETMHDITYAEQLPV